MSRRRGMRGVPQRTPLPSGRGKCVEPMLASDPLQRDVPACEELDVSTGCEDELMDSRRNEDLAADSLARDPRGIVHGGAEEVLRVLDGVPGMDADPHANGR